MKLWRCGAANNQSAESPSGCFALSLCGGCVGLERNFDLRVGAVDEAADIDAHLHEVRIRLPRLAQSGASVFHYGATGTPTYDFVIVEGMRHLYPNGENFGFAAVDVFWPFLKQQHR